MSQKDAFQAGVAIGEARQGQGYGHPERLANVVHYLLAKIAGISRVSAANQLDELLQALLDEIGHTGDKIHVGMNVSIRL